MGEKLSSCILVVFNVRITVSAIYLACDSCLLSALLYCIVVAFNEFNDDDDDLYSYYSIF